MGVLLRVLLLCALAAPGLSLSCLHCEATDSTCKGDSLSCSQACGLIYLETNEDEKITRRYIKSCIRTRSCNKVSTISFNGGTRRIGTSCCYTDNCTPPLPKLPTNSPKPNGLTCPTCWEKNDSSCYPKTDIKCSGDEKMCMEQSARSKINSIRSFEIIIGCAAEGFCDDSYISYESGDNFLTFSLRCNPATSTGKATPLSCFQCARTNQPCQGFSVTCPPEHSCGLIFKENIEDGKVYKDYIKNCVPQDKCNMVGSITHTRGKMNFGISCCDTDHCTPKDPQWPIDSKQANGVSCPTCRDTKNIKCNPETELQCAGSEQACVYHSTEKTGFKESAMGCASQSLCDIGSVIYKSDPVLFNMQFSCDSKTVESQPTSNLLICVICTSNDALECEGALQLCPPNYVCASSYKTTITPGNKADSIVRSCIPEDKCVMFGTMSLNSRKMAMGVSCCKEDGCIPSIPKWKTKLEKINSVKCKSCISSESSTCESNDTIECRGDEKHCVDYSVTTTSEFYSSSYSFSGCGTQTLCNAQSYTLANENIERRYHFTCA